MRVADRFFKIFSGMEAIWKIEVEDFPAFILVDDKGNDFFTQINEKCKICPLKK